MGAEAAVQPEAGVVAEGEPVVVVEPEVEPVAEPEVEQQVESEPELVAEPVADSEPEVAEPSTAVTPPAEVAEALPVDVAEVSAPAQAPAASRIAPAIATSKAAAAGVAAWSSKVAKSTSERVATLREEAAVANKFRAERAAEKAAQRAELAREAAEARAVAEEADARAAAEQAEARAAADANAVAEAHTLAEPEQELSVIVPEAPSEPAELPKATKAKGAARATPADDLFVLPAHRPTKGTADVVLSVSGLTKRFDDKVAVAGIDLEVKVGDFYGIVGPNGAGKTTTLSMITGLLRPDAGTVTVHGSDVWSDTAHAKRSMGVLPDRLRLFDRLTGGQLLYYAAVLRGLDGETARSRTGDLARAFGLEESLGRLVSDYSAGMTKKIALAAAMIHSPRLLVLDEPFESVDPVSAATVTDILKKYVAAGGTVVLSSHSMDLVQRICDNVAVVVRGEILADGTMESVRNGGTLEERFVELAGGLTTVEGLEWLHSFSD